MKFLSLSLLIVLLVSCARDKNNESTPPIGRDDDPKGVVREGNTKDNGWHLKDALSTSSYGISSDKAYIDFNLKQKREIIVAVIDSGVDVDHEDLQGQIWVNTGEIADNGIDDDKNGYIDDINGWNFIGGSDGKNIEDESLEVTRIFSRLSKINAIDLSEEQKLLLAEVKEVVDRNVKKYSERITKGRADLIMVQTYEKILAKQLDSKKIETKAQLEAIIAEDSEVKEIKEKLLELWGEYWKGLPGIKGSIERAEVSLNVHYNVDYDKRGEIVKDDPSDFTDRSYGNNDMKGGDPSHGTHVAGIIAAKRNNGFGINGIAENVKIMVLRAVPNGDERDKDIALSVRYAVDNGANIINMSFGKGYSPYKKQVDEAFQYAAEKGVLLVHAAGNSSKNIDYGMNNFPNTYLNAGEKVTEGKRLTHFLEIGASAKTYGLDLVASFSNFGKDAVTLFSPGKGITSTTPDNNYESFSGTSMASPVAAGVAALIMSEFPTITASETLEIIKETVLKGEQLKVRKPSDDKKDIDFRIPVLFSELSQTGGLINSYRAIELAKNLANKK
jgi:cell wall-associated protease